MTGRDSLGGCPIMIALVMLIVIIAVVTTHLRNELDDIRRRLARAETAIYRLQHKGQQ